MNNSNLSESSSRIQQKCAYHQKQNITNFCKCEDCLLPVCPICIQVHTQQHRSMKTSPEFVEINKIYEEIKTVMGRLENYIDEISRYLSQIEGQRKKNQNEMRQIMLTQRLKLIKQFEKSLIDMENKIINEIIKVDKQFVRNLSQVDQDLNRIKARTKKSKFNLQSEDTIKHMIIYFGKKTDTKYRTELDQIKKRADQLSKIKMNVVVRQEEIANVKRLVGNFIKFQAVDTGSKKQSKNNSIVNQIRSRNG